MADRGSSRPIHAADLAGQGMEAGAEAGRPSASMSSAGTASAAPASLTPPSDDDGTSTVYFHSALSSVDGGGAQSAGSNGKDGQQGLHRQQSQDSQPDRNVPSRSATPPALPGQQYKEPPSSSGSEDRGKSAEEEDKDTPGARADRERVIQASKDLDATKQDYFSRHPNPDANLRNEQGGSTRRNRARKASNASRPANRASTHSTSSQSEEEGAGNRSITGGGLFSPALSTGTALSAGVSLGATMGGSERIFPIRSVVVNSRHSASSRETANPYSPSGSADSTGNHALYEGYFPAPSSSSRSDGPQSAGRGDGQRAEDDEAADEFEHSTYGHEYSRRSPIPDDTSDFSFPRLKGTREKPDYSRQLSSQSTQDSGNSGPTTLGATSYPTTSHYSDDSDPTARRNSSTSYTPTTAMSQGPRSVSSSRHPGMPRIDSTNKDPDIIKLAKDAYDAGEAEEGPSVESGHLGSITRDKDGLYLTVRFEHQETDDGHAIVTGRKGELLKCEDEPIHIPGAIQEFGVLIAIEEDDNGKFVVVQASENSGLRLGLPPKHLFSLGCFSEALDEDQADAFLEAMENLEDNARDNESGDDTSSLPTNDPSASLAALNSFQLSGEGIPGSGLTGDDSKITWSCWCAVHRPSPKLRPKLAILEFEIENDLLYPIMRERTEQEIAEDRRKDQPHSLFGDGTDDSPDPRDLQDPRNPGDVSVSGSKEPENAFPIIGRADGEVELPDAKASSLHGMVGQGGNNESSNDAQTSSGVGGSSSSATASSTARDSTTNPSPDPEGLGTMASKEEIDSSTISRVKPIRALRRLRKSKDGGNIMKLFSILGQINDELNKAQDLQTSLEIAAGVVAEVTGFHRVMIYQFDEQWNGQVVAELVDYKQTRDLYRGLHFPASDIPAQARELYKLNKVRLLYDRDQPTARLVCRNLKELETPLDMTHAHLRAMSPIHIKYLANMGVRASMSISIIAFGQLWGLISCHTYGRYGQRVSFPGRQLCRIIGDSVSRNIERLSYAQRLQSRKLFNTIPTNSNPGGYIIAKAEDLLQLFDADFGVLSIGDEAKILGSLENSQEVLAILEYLRVKRFDQVQVSTNILGDFDDLDYPAGFQTVAGMLTVPLASGGADFIAFFRRGQLEHVHWAGNPYDKVMRENKQNKTMLEPRKSFKIWSETVVGRARAWSDENLETASVLRLVYGKFIEVWRQREAAVTSSRLTSLLLSNASHEVRTPLNHIINYLEMALEGQLDEDTRESLVRSHSASRALVHVINDLLDLTRTETGKDMFSQDPLDLGEIIEEAVAIHRMEAQRRGVAFEIVENPSGTPQTLLGDRAKLRQIVANVAANAVKHTHDGKVTVEWGELSKEADDPAEASQDTIKIGIAIEDTGVGIPEDQLEEMFRTFEQVESEDENAPAKSTGNLGLGLAVVARIISQLGGQLRVESKVGYGSKFTFVLHFRLPGPEDTNRRGSVNSGSTHARRSISTGSHASGIGEPAQGVVQRLQRRSSSGGSRLSGGFEVQSRHSEIDSLVEAISSNPASRSDGSRSGGIKNVARPVQKGSINVEDSGTPLRSLRIDTSEVEVPQMGSQTSNPRSEMPGLPRRATSANVRGTAVHSMPAAPPHRRHPSASGAAPLMSPPIGSIHKGPPGDTSTAGRHMRIMIVEDDAINRAILLKKLTKDFAHEVKQAVHGEEAVRLYEKDRDFDMVLMDLQMPICDGYTATRRIREVEQKADPTETDRHPATNGEVPIFAVSASLHEHQKPQLVECGFSGFILKPVDFARLSELMRGALDETTRAKNLYQPGRWEKGGWLSAAGINQSPAVSQSSTLSDA